MLVNRIQEQGLNIEVILGGHFHELVAYFRSSLHPFLSRDLLFNLSTLVGNQPLRAFLFRAMGFDILKKLRKFFKGFDILGIIDKKDDGRPLVVSRGDGSESFMTGGIPELQINDIPAGFNLLYLKISADCRNIFLTEFVYNEALG